MFRCVSIASEIILGSTDQTSLSDTQTHQKIAILWRTVSTFSRNAQFLQWSTAFAILSSVLRRLRYKLL